MSKRDRLEMVARHVLTREGLSGFTMERLAEAAEVSRPTAYQYFGSREGALTATAASTLALGRKLFDASCRFKGHPREQGMALMMGFEILARFEPDHLETLEFIEKPWVKRALSPSVLETMEELVKEFGVRLTHLMQTSIDCGQLNLPPDYPLKAAVFHTQNFAYGIFLAIAHRRITYQLLDSEHPWENSRQGLHLFWDGLGWEPRAGTAELEMLHERILKSCFPDYWLRIKTDELKRDLDTPLTEAPGLTIPEPKRRGRGPKSSS